MNVLIVLILSNFIKFVVPLGLFVWALFMPRAAGYTYLVLYGLFAGYLFLIDSFKPKPDQQRWTAEEIEIIRKYYLALRFSFGAKDMSVYLNGFRWAGILWLILFLFNQMWFAAGFVTVAFFVTADISVRLDPFFFLAQGIQSGQLQFSRELSLLQTVSKRLQNGERL